MLEWSKLKKKLFVFSIIFLFLVSLVTALEECEQIQDSDDVPCMLLLPYVDDCTNINVSIYLNSSDLGYNQTMSTYANNVCNATFNQTTLGSYTIHYYTGGAWFNPTDTWSLTVTEGSKMIYLFYFGLAATLALLILGLVKEEYVFLSLSGLGFFLMGVYIFMYGFSTLNNLMTLLFASIFWAAGGYIFIKTQLDNVQASGI